jgi:single-stranded DNA-binding protein
MNKVYIDGWIYNIQLKQNSREEYYVDFLIKSKRIIGVRKDAEPIYEYYPFKAFGKKALNINRNLKEGQRVYIWAKMTIDELGFIQLYVDEIEFL